jgi:hypothetical protein
MHYVIFNPEINIQAQEMQEKFPHLLFFPFPGNIFSTRQTSMPLLFGCDTCGLKLKAPDQHAGKLARCPKCGAKNRVPIPAHAKAPQPAKNPTKLPTKPTKKTPKSPSARKTNLPEKGNPSSSKKKIPPQPTPSPSPANANPVFLLGAGFPLLMGPVAFFLNKSWLLWGGVGLVLALIAVVLALVENWNPTSRLAGVVVLGCSGFLGMFFLPIGEGSLVWEKFTPPDGAFAIDFPGIPATSTNFVGGFDVPWQSFKVERGRLTFEVGYAEFPQAPPSPGEFLEMAQQRLLSHKGKVVKKEDLALKQYFGKEIILEGTSQGTMAFRIYLVDRRLYQIEVVGIAEPALLTRFFESFVIQRIP